MSRVQLGCGDIRVGLIGFVLVGAALASAGACASDLTEAGPSDNGSLRTIPLKLGLLLDFSGPPANYGPELRRGFEPAITQISAVGGVWGRPGGRRSATSRSIRRSLCRRRVGGSRSSRCMRLSVQSGAR